MTRYINADVLRELIDEGYDLDFSELPETKRELLHMIDYQETADVREVVHGKWRKVYPAYELNIIARKHEPCYVCSKCNAHVDVKTPFCSNCGADMRGDK